MAKTKTEEDLDLDVEKEAPPVKKGGKLKLILIVVGALVLLGGIGGGAWYFLHSSGGEEDTAAKQEEDAKSAKTARKTVAGKKKPKKGEPGMSAMYYAFDPAFVVNFEDQGVVRFLQITVEVGTHDPLVVEALKLHMPVIRNNLVMLFSSQDLQSITSREAKEKLRGQALSEIRKVLEEQTGDPGVENVYFTSFVMQ